MINDFGEVTYFSEMMNSFSLECTIFYALNEQLKPTEENQSHILHTIRARNWIRIFRQVGEITGSRSFGRGCHNRQVKNHFLCKSLCLNQFLCSLRLFTWKCLIEIFVWIRKRISRTGVSQYFLQYQKLRFLLQKTNGILYKVYFCSPNSLI